ncbi:MAG TPA: KUP/HAK/KT family potassium transporter, partial [Novosphingobium sp.]|nr:KUP/HAK/KT family potassium transporter [Novosphingobium sp.]
LAVLGLMYIVRDPMIVLHTLNPLNAVQFFILDGFRAFIALGSVVLAVTGAEALYADMGHFGRKPIAISWVSFVMPCLLLNYMGQGAMVLSYDEAKAAEIIKDPFFLMIPDMVRIPVIFLALAATIIASQAVISGAFSLTHQAIQLGFMPRMQIKHTSASTAGQIYIPVLNWGLMDMVVMLVVGFGSSSNLAAAYGIAVTGAMFIDTLLMAAVLISLWKWPLWKALPLVAVFIVVDMAYLGANLLKVPDGGWVPLAMGLVFFTMLTTWSKGRQLMRANMAEGSIPVEVFAKSAHSSAARVPGTAVFMSASDKGVPSALLHNIKHNKVLHERVVILTVDIQEVPYVDEAERFAVKDMGNGFYRLYLRYGFLEETDVPAALKSYKLCGEPFEMMKTSFFLSRQTLLPSARPGMALWRERLFAWMLRNAASAMEFFRLPTNRVVELGSQVEI